MKAAIFDLDGVIVDTVPLHFKAWKKMFNEYGKEFTFDDYEKYVDGIPRMDGARSILKDLPQNELIEAANKKQSYYLGLLNKEKIPAYNTTVDFIKGLKAKGVKLAVISSSKNCPYILEKIGVDKIIDTQVTGKDITKGKPDPQIFLMAAERLQVDPKDCVVFEDAILGVEAAKNAKMKCVGIDRYQNPQRLSKANVVVSDLGEFSLDKFDSLFTK